jgi:hypothetical protein
MIKQTLKPRLSHLLSIYGPFLVMLVVMNFQTEVPITTLTRDIFELTKVPSYTGLISNIGSLIWCSTLTVCWFSALAFRKTIKPSMLWFLIYSGTISGLLMLDDFFILHESFYKTHLHLSENRVRLGYGIITITYMVVFRKIILRTDFTFLGLALFCFGLSVGLDAIADVQYRAPMIAPDPYFLWEDGSKLLGIVSWCAYIVRTCLNLFQPAP